MDPSPGSERRGGIESGEAEGKKERVEGVSRVIETEAFLFTADKLPCSPSITPLYYLSCFLVFLFVNQ